MTSIACEFETELGKLVVYGTIIGTLYNRKPFAEKELQNCISDCIKIYEENPNLIIVGDLNTAFLEIDKEDFKINKSTTDSLINIFEKLDLMNSTMNIKENIDHIIIPKLFENRLKNLLGHDANPWTPKDAFMASAMYLTDLGAKGNSASSQQIAACKYYGTGGASCSYSKSVMNFKSKIQADIDYINQYGTVKR